MRIDYNNIISSAKSESKEDTNIQEIPNSDDVYILGFTKSDNPQNTCPNVDPESDECFAKMHQWKSDGEVKAQYFIKYGRNGFMYDPWGMFTEGTNTRMAKLTGQKFWEFRKVNETAFSYYLNFLQTRKESWRIQAERIINNG